MKVGVTTLSRICRLQTSYLSIHNVKAIVAVCCRIHLTVFVNDKIWQILNYLGHSIWNYSDCFVFVAGSGKIFCKNERYVNVVSRVVYFYCRITLGKYKRISQLIPCYMFFTTFPIYSINPLQPSFPFLYPLKTSENLMFSGGIEKQHRAVIG